MTLIKRHNHNWNDPFDVLGDFSSEMSRALGTWGRGTAFAGSFSPDIDFHEEKDRYVLKADLPGLKKEEIDVSVHGSTLVLKGERKEETEKKEKGYVHTERRYGSFQRAFELPGEIEAGKIKASYKDGVLELSVPKSERAQPKQIQVDVD